MSNHLREDILLDLDLGRLPWLTPLTFWAGYFAALILLALSLAFRRGWFA